MDIQQLKSLAERVRALLQKSNQSVGHNQSLDLVSALPGLRNWPEVQAFPDRLAACELDAASAGRLAFRLKKKFELELSPNTILAALGQADGKRPGDAPHIWAAGPAPGVYVTTSHSAVNALLERYEEATDGALVYAERAGSHWEGSIDLGESGLWSNGLARVPGGTLVIVGPVELNQQSWEDSARRLEIACLHALNYEHRVVVLIDTQTPEAVCEDVLLMVRSVQPAGEDYDTALLGVVTEDGDLQRRAPFARPRPRPAAIRSVATIDAIPPAALPALRKAVAGRSSGLLLFGSAVLGEHAAIDLIAAALALTEHAGPAARIMPRKRSTPAKDWQVPEAIKQLPFLPSIESAYDQGYRRMIYTSSYTDGELLLKYSDKVLLITGAFACDVMDVFMSTMRGGGPIKEGELLARTIAMLGVTPIPTKHGEVVASDFFVNSGSDNVQPKNFDEIEQYLRANRVLRWEDEVGLLLDSGVVKATSLKKALPRSRNIHEFLSQRAAAKKKAASPVH